MNATALTADTPATFLSADRRRELEDQVLPAGTRIRRDERDAAGVGTFQASPGGRVWYNYRAR